MSICSFSVFFFFFLFLRAHHFRQTGFSSFRDIYLPSPLITTPLQATAFSGFSKKVVKQLSWPLLARNLEGHKGSYALHHFAMIISPKFLVPGPGTHPLHTPTCRFSEYGSYFISPGVQEMFLFKHFLYID